MTCSKCNYCCNNKQNNNCICGVGTSNYELFNELHKQAIITNQNKNRNFFLDLIDKETSNWDYQRSGSTHSP